MTSRSYLLSPYFVVAQRADQGTGRHRVSVGNLRQVGIFNGKNERHQGDDDGFEQTKRQKNSLKSRFFFVLSRF